MSDPISLTHLRAEYNVTRFRGLTFVQMLTPDTLLALIEVAELAQAYHSLGLAADITDDGPLLDALSRFTFGDPNA